MNHFILMQAVEAEGPLLLSWLKPVLVTLVIVGWAWVVSELDKDAEYYNLRRYWLNAGHMAVGAAALAVMVFVPMFFVGFPLGVLLIVGWLLGYAWHRNRNVPEHHRWSMDLESFKSRFKEMERAYALRHASILLLGPDKEPLPVPQGEDPMADAHLAFENLCNFAFARNAETIELAVESEKVSLNVRIDGVKYPQTPPEPEVAARLVDYLKSASGLDVEERRKKQSGKLVVNAQELGQYTLAVESSGSTRGVAVTLTINPTTRARIPLAQLGFTTVQQQQVEQIISDTDSQGVVLVTAPPRHGLTTTLCSLVDAHDPYTANIYAIQRREICELEAVSFHPIPEGTPSQEFDAKLAALIRTEPNVMLLPELRGPQTAHQAAKNAEHTRFYIGMREPDTFSAVARWTKHVGSRQTAANALSAVIAQRLVRKICPTCRTPYKPDAKALKKLNLPADRVSQLYHASGQVIVRDQPQNCPSCFGLGYFGRIGTFEVMVLDDEARRYLAENDMARLRSHLRKHKMLWLQEAALSKVVEGVTDIREVTRVQGDQSGGSKAGKAKEGQGKAAPAASSDSDKQRQPAEG